MSPEQHAGKELDPRSDQYSFAIALWQALYGQRPFTAEGPDRLHVAKRRGPPKPPPRPRVPARVRHAIVRALSRRRGDRFPDMDALLVELRPPAAAVAVDGRVRPGRRRGTGRVAAPGREGPMPGRGRGHRRRVRRPKGGAARGPVRRAGLRLRADGLVPHRTQTVALRVRVGRARDADVRGDPGRSRRNAAAPRVRQALPRGEQGGARRYGVAARDGRPGHRAARRRHARRAPGQRPM